MLQLLEKQWSLSLVACTLDAHVTSFMCCVVGLIISYLPSDPGSHLIPLISQKSWVIENNISFFKWKSQLLLGVHLWTFKETGFPRPTEILQESQLR